MHGDILYSSAMADLTPNRRSTDDSADWETIARYFAGESTAAEQEAVRRWLDAHPDQAEALAALDGATSRLAQASPPGLDVEAALRRVVERRDADGVTPIDSRRAVKPVAPVSVPRRWQQFAIPAAAAAVLAIGVVLYRHFEGTPGYTPPSAAQTVATSVGQRDSVRLPDGTRVVLAPESELIIAAGYGADVREVELRGEAYFDVLHDEARPFVVRAGGATIRDLGTTFTVRTTSEQGVRVAVTSGLVSLAAAQAAGDSVVLRPGDAGTLTPDGRRLVERRGATEPDTAWMRGRLVFNEASMPAIRAELRRWYGIDLQIDSSFASKHWSGTIEGESVDNGLARMASGFGAVVERQGNVAILKPASRPR